MPYSFIANEAAAGDTNVATTPAFDSTGADFGVAMVGLYSGAGSSDAVDGDVTDSKGNNWDFLIRRETAGLFTEVALFWSRLTSVGSGHTVSFQRGAQASFPALAVAVFAGSAASPVDQGNGDDGGSGEDIATGNLAAVADHTLIVTGVATGATVTIDGVAAADGFTVTDIVDYANGVNIGVGLAYKILPTAATEGTTWELSTTTDRSALIASFLSAAVATSNMPGAPRFVRGARSHRRRRAA